MYQKDLIRGAWQAAGLYDEDDPRLQRFLALLENPAHCWPELIAACRQDYAVYKARVVQPILDSGDPLVRLVVIRAAAETDELKLLERYVAGSDPARDAAELRAIALKGVPRLNRALARKPDLPQAVRDMLAAPALAG